MAIEAPPGRLPVRPDLNRLLQEARELHVALRAQDPQAMQQLVAFHDKPVHPDDAELADAQFVVARRYQASTWHRLVQACQLSDAIWDDDLLVVQSLVTRNRALLFEPVLIRRDSNWGAPMAYAANVGRDGIVQWLHDNGAVDHEHAMGRAALQGKTSTVHLLHRLAGSPPVGVDMLGGPAYTLNASGNAALLALGVPVVSGTGDRLAPVAVVLETDSRRPEAKHAILESWVEQGLTLPDTPVMAMHRGRLDLLEQHLARDPQLLQRHFRHRDIYPTAMGCRAPIDATVGTPLDGTTLLHMAIEFDEPDIVQWCLSRGADVNARAHVGTSGFGGYTPLFNTVVSMPGFWWNYAGQSPYAGDTAALLLAHGADPQVRASLWKQLHPGHGNSARHEYRDVTARSWGEQFHAPVFVNKQSLQHIIDAGGLP